MSTVRFTAEILPDGTIRLPDDVQLAPGKAEVTVEQADDTKKGAAEKGGVPQIARDLAELAACLDATDLPYDLAQNHDHYLHGSAKGIDAR
jgi:hypothetical protein